MLFKIAVCDDELSEIKKICDFITRFSFESEIEFIVDRYTNGKSLIKAYNAKTAKYDIIFLDVEMPQLDGIETAQLIREFPDRNVLIVFITSYPEYMQDSFDVQAFQYLTKPISYHLFKEKFQKIIGYINELQTNIAVVSLKKGEILLYLDEVICFETIKNMTTKSYLLVTTTTEEFEIKGKIAEMETRLKDQYFISVHRSVLVNMKYIKKFNANLVELTNGKTVEISRRKLSEVKDTFSKYMIVRYKK